MKEFFDINDPLIIADLFSETVGGGSNTVGALGNGRLTVGISPWGELVYYRWPTPSHYDHLRYVTKSYSMLSGLLKVKNVRYGGDAPCIDWKKYGRPYEKYSGLGAKAGIFTKKGQMLWMDDPVWNSKRSYTPEWSDLLTTELKNNEKQTEEKISFKTRQWVDVEKDLLIQNFVINPSNVESFFYYGTFAPWMTNPTSITNPDLASAGFACLYDPSTESLIWFYPKNISQKRAASKFKKAFNDNPNMGYQELDSLFPDGGIFITMNVDRKIESWQVGADIEGRKKSKSFPESAREDAQDGILQKTSLHIGHQNAGFKINLKAEKNPNAKNNKKNEITVYIAVAESSEEGIKINRDAMKKGIKELEKVSRKKWEKNIEKIKISQRAAKLEKQVAERSIANLLIGRDKNSGAIVASPTRQPCYACDWPRDGAFYDMTLDLAGFSDIVDDHIKFYRDTQRKETKAFSTTWLASFRSPFFNPRGHWYANMNTDGTPGFFKIIPLEIDETSLMVWNLWRHDRYLKGKSQKEFRQLNREMLMMAMEAILPYVDLKNGWTRKIMEDDNHIVDATLHGASSVLTALASAVDMGEKWKISGSLIEKWKEAAVILRKGMLKKINNPKVLKSAGWRGIQWSLFPAPLFKDYTEGEAAPLIEIILEDLVDKVIHEKGGVGYLGEQLFILCAATRGLDNTLLPEKYRGKDKKMTYLKFKKKVLDFFVREVPMEGTCAYGELGLWREINGKRFIQNRTSIPHLWNGVTSYLSVIGVYEPEKIKALRPPIPEN